MILRKNYSFSLLIDGKAYYFTYQQATAMETMDFMSMFKNPDFNPYEWSYGFLSEHIVKPWYKRIFSREKYLLLGTGTQKVFELVIDTRFRGAFSEKDSDENWTPEGSFWALISSELHTDPITLAEKYTFEQLKELAEGIAWNYNERSDDGKKKNSALRAAKKIQANSVSLKTEMQKLEEYRKEREELKKKST